ncbi:MAG: helix-turn-helix domain-containing protein [Clostridia bacterium]|nr:helix-turn-helix domain-containing protein [Clostridia bacterium]
MELGKKIRQLRLKVGLTQEQLAERLGLAPQSVSKWENQAAMPDIITLPMISEVFGISIDDLFDLTVEQRLNRIESRLDMEEDIDHDIFRDYEEYLKSLLGSEKYGKRALELISFLYWHRMDTYARKTDQYAKEAVKLSPNEKGCQWMLQKASGHSVWDWNINNHSNAVDFYSELIKADPKSRLSYYYLLDNLIADHRADEAEEVLKKLCALKDTRPVINEVYRAHIALARFDAKTADSIMEKLVNKHGNDSACLFEAAQYYALKCDYDKAIDLYERSFATIERKPRFQDELMGIAAIYRIRKDYRKAAETYDRIIALLHDEWGMTDEVEIQNARKEKAAMLDKI